MIRKIFWAAIFTVVLIPVVQVLANGDALGDFWQLLGLSVVLLAAAVDQFFGGFPLVKWIVRFVAVAGAVPFIIIIIGYFT
jgi:hypothetical protein